MTAVLTVCMHNSLTVLPMMYVVVFLSLFFWTVVAVAVNLPLNPQAPFVEEIQSVQHHFHQREITIELKAVRRCQKPTFRVRISGTSLFMPHLKKVDSDMLVYTYPELSDEGVYFVEIVALLCDHYEPEAFSKTCLVSVAEGKSIVTLPYTFEVKANETNKSAMSPRPRWVLPDNKRNAATFLPTRYQKTGCQNGFCPTVASDLWQHDLYEWVDSANYSKSLHDVLSLSRQDKRNQPADSIVRVCLIGDSHSRDLTMYGNKLNVDGAEFVYILTIYPHEFNVTWLDTHNCSYAVVSYGQWPGSFRTEGHPYTQTKYEQEMRRVITLLQNYDHARTQVFVHSVNYNALMSYQTSCPPVDFRTPPVIDMYNAVLRKLCKELDVGYIDMNHIMGPMWDSAFDWCHPSSKIYTAEVQLILQSVLQSSLQHQRPVTLFPGEVANAAIVRYTDSSSVYLLHHGEIRAFPNAFTFTSMGYSFDNVKVIHASLRKHVKLGPELPVITEF